MVLSPKKQIPHYHRNGYASKKFLKIFRKLEDILLEILLFVGDNLIYDTGKYENIY